MLEQTQENIGNLEEKLYRVVKRPNSRVGNVNQLPTEGYVIASDSTEAYRKLAKKYGPCNYIAVLVQR